MYFHTECCLFAIGSLFYSTLLSLPLCLHIFVCVWLLGVEQRRKPGHAERGALRRHDPQHLHRLLQRAGHHVVVLRVRDHLCLGSPRVQVKERTTSIMF